MLDGGPAVGSEQAGRRPYLVASIGAMNEAPAELAVVMPLTTTPWPNALHVRLDPAECELPRVSYVMPEMVKSLSLRRFGPRVGAAPLEVVDRAARNCGLLIGLGRRKR
jgi:mRNA-degrading endonuclease toxin of MazEF toxin-antitoxin module